MAYDSATNQVVLVSAESENMTWVWSGTDWHAMSGGPFINSSPELAYDPTSKSLLMTQDNGLAGDAPMWAWNGSSWHQLAATVPDAYCWIFATDYAANDIVCAAEHGGTFVWSDGGWVRGHADSDPNVRSYAGGAYASTTHRVVEFGGLIGPQNNITAEMDAWDASSWVSLPS